MSSTVTKTKHKCDYCKQRIGAKARFSIVEQAQDGSLEMETFYKPVLPARNQRRMCGDCHWKLVLKPYVEAQFGKALSIADYTPPTGGPEHE